MTNQTPLTAQQQIEYVAKFMGITVVRRKGKWMKEECGGGGWREYSPWNLFENWNIWRQVEKRVMEDDELLAEYMDRLMCVKELGQCYVRLVLTDLPTRVSALIAAHQSLYAS